MVFILYSYFLGQEWKCISREVKVLIMKMLKVNNKKRITA